MMDKMQDAIIKMKMHVCMCVFYMHYLDSLETSL